MTSEQKVEHLARLASVAAYGWWGDLTKEGKAEAEVFERGFIAGYYSGRDDVLEEKNKENQYE